MQCCLKKADGQASAVSNQRASAHLLDVLLHRHGLFVAHGVMTDMNLKSDRGLGQK